MSKTKSGFLKAGAILGIISAVFVALFGIAFIAEQKIVTPKFYIEEVFECQEGNYQVTENPDGSLTYDLTIDGEVVSISSSKLDLLISLTKSTMVTIGVYCIISAVAELVLSILVLVKTNKQHCKNGLIVALLVLSLISANIVTTAFMIVALCLKNKKQEDIALEQEPSQV